MVRQATCSPYLEEIQVEDNCILIGNYEFKGPFDSPKQIEERAGVFAVLCYHDGEYDLLEIAFSENLRQGIIDHPDQGDWHSLCQGTLLAAVFYADETGMDADQAQVLIDCIERELSDTPCAA